MKRFNFAFTLAEVFSPHPKSQRKAAFTLAEVLSPHSQGQRKAAFTLAEVLITLGIIGVVAAITMPTLIQNYKKTVYVNQLKKCVSTWSQAVKKVLADEETDNIKNTEIFQAMEEENGCLDWYSDYGSGECWFMDKLAKDYFNAEIIEVPDGYSWNVIGNSNYNDEPTNHTLFLLPDGSLGEFLYVYDDGADVSVDVNGFKGPNTYGRDVFDFNITLNGAVMPRNPDVFLSSRCPGDFADGASCFARIMENGWKMDY